MDWIMSTFRNMIKSDQELKADYEKRKIAFNKKGNLELSTCWVHDYECYETAIIDSNGVHPINRCTSKEDALLYHAHILSILSDGMKILKLGSGDDLIPDDVITIKE